MWKTAVGRAAAEGRHEPAPPACSSYGGRDADIPLDAPSSQGSTSWHLGVIEALTKMMWKSRTLRLPPGELSVTVSPTSHRQHAAVLLYETPR